MLRELSSAAPHLVAQFLPEASELSRLACAPVAFGKMRATLWAALAVVAPRLGGSATVVSDVQCAKVRKTSLTHTRIARKPKLRPCGSQVPSLRASFGHEIRVVIRVFKAADRRVTHTVSSTIFEYDHHVPQYVQIRLGFFFIRNTSPTAPKVRHASRNPRCRGCPWQTVS